MKEIFLILGWWKWTKQIAEKSSLLFEGIRALVAWFPFVCIQVLSIGVLPALQCSPTTLFLHVCFHCLHCHCLYHKEHWASRWFVLANSIRRTFSEARDYVFCTLKCRVLDLKIGVWGLISFTSTAYFSSWDPDYTSRLEPNRTTTWVCAGLCLFQSTVCKGGICIVDRCICDDPLNINLRKRSWLLNSYKCIHRLLQNSWLLPNRKHTCITKKFKLIQQIDQNKIFKVWK